MAKLFVGGINDSLNDEEIKDYFGKFGEVKDLVVVKDKVTGIPKGFGFVEFSDPTSAQKALDEQVHKIGERNVDVKRTRPRGEKRQYQLAQYQYQYPYQYPQYQYPVHPQYVNNGPNSNNTDNLYNDENPTKSKKIFVGGLSSSITENDFRTYFEGFGRITDVVIMYDNSTHRPRGFGFVTFDSSEAVDSVLKQKYHELNSKKVEVKVAIPKDSDSRNNSIDCYNSKLIGGAYGFYPPPDPRFGFCHGYRPPVVPPFFHGGYGIRPYGGSGFRAPLVRSPYGPNGMMVGRWGPVIFGSAPMYPNYYSGWYNAAYTTDSTNNKGAEGAGGEKLDVVKEES